MEKKVCKKCGIEKVLTTDYFHFYNNRWRNICRECEIQQHRDYNRKNRELINFKKREYNKKPEVKEHNKEYKKQYRTKNSEKIKEKNKQYRDNEQSKLVFQKWYEKNKEKIMERNKLYFKTHKKEMVERERLKRQTDEVYRLKNNVRKAIRRALEYNDIEKCKVTEKITKMRIDNLKQYLLKTYKDRYGYEWDGKEEVDVDHIIPLVKAKTKEDVINLSHYTNLQLLKSKDNNEKGIKAVDK